MNEAIKLKLLQLANYHPSRVKSFDTVLLEAEFWQALGRALGWENKRVCGGCGHYRFQHCCELGSTGWVQYEWEFYAIKYLTLKLTGHDEEKFWLDLLK